MRHDLAFNLQKGELNHYKWYVDTFVFDLKVKWNTDGSGQWWTYNENGDVKNSGSCSQKLN